MAERDASQIVLLDVPVTARALPRLLKILAKHHTISLSVDERGHFVCSAKVITDTPANCVIRIDASRIGSLSIKEIVEALTYKLINIEKRLVLSVITYMPRLQLHKDKITEENDDALFKLLRDPYVTDFELTSSLLSDTAAEALAVRIGRAKKLTKLKLDKVDFATQAQRVNFVKRISLLTNLTEIMLLQCGLDDACITEGDYFLKVLNQLRVLDLSGNLFTDKINDKFAEDFRRNLAITSIELGIPLSAKLQKVIERNKEIAILQENIQSLQNKVNLVETALMDVEKLNVDNLTKSTLLQLLETVKLYNTCFSQMVREENFEANKKIVVAIKNTISNLFTKCIELSQQRPYLFNFFEISDFVSQMVSLLNYNSLMPRQWLLDVNRIYFLNQSLSWGKFDEACLNIERLELSQQKNYITEMKLLCYLGSIVDYIAARKTNFYGFSNNTSLIYEKLTKLKSDKDMHNPEGAKVILQYICCVLRYDIFPTLSQIKSNKKDALLALDFSEEKTTPSQLRDLLDWIMNHYGSESAAIECRSHILATLLPLIQLVISELYGEQISLRGENKQALSLAVGDLFSYEEIRDKARRSLATTKIYADVDSKNDKSAPRSVAPSKLSRASMYPAEGFNKGKERDKTGVALGTTHEIKDRSLQRAARYT